MSIYIGLFFSSFLAATLVPFYSELTLAGLLTLGYPIGLLWTTATLGNSLGAMVNWLVGRYLLHHRHHRWFPIRQKELDQSQEWFQRYGVWSLLFAWLPIVGDALPLMAGTMRTHFGLCLLLVTIGKGLRYAAVILLTPGLT